jgi:integrase
MIRDCAFFDGLYGTGLRLTEWASLVLPEVPAQTSSPYSTVDLADACAKGGYGHQYWIPNRALSAVNAYIEGARARAVLQAQQTGLYERQAGLALVGDEKSRRGFVLLPVDEGAHEPRSWNLIRPAHRRVIFRRTPAGLEPLALWLNEDGLPRDPHGWHHTFTEGNRRVAAAGIANFICTAHMVRHSFALRWFSVGMLVYNSRLAHLDAEEAKDFRAQFGDTWHLVQSLLGHRNVETTKNVYLEPFRSLSVEVLLAQTQGLEIPAFMSAAFSSHPMVQSDPISTA